jgi:zinc transport system substrate-binding protein
MNPYHCTSLFDGIDHQKQLMRLLRRSLALLLVLVMLFFTVSCTATGLIVDQNNRTGKKDGLVFVTSVYPLYLATAQIAKGIDKVTVRNLTEEVTGCLHDYQLTTGNMKTLEKADVFIINGVGLENYIETVARDLPNLRLITAADGIDIVANNPHVWVSITNMIRQVETIAGQMGAIDPANKEAFAKNAKLYIDQLTAQRQKMHDSIDSLPERRIVTVHEAFTYFAAEFNLDIVGVIEREPDSEPSAAELANTIQLIRNKKVRAVFAEPQYPATAAQQIAEESGVRMYLLDPAASGDLKNLDAYLTIMEKNRQVLVEALR